MKHMNLILGNFSPKIKNKRGELLKLLIIVVFSATLTACTSAPPAPPVIVQTFEHLSVLQLTTPAPDFIDNHKPDAKTLELIRRGLGPKDLVMRWMADRLKPASLEMLHLGIRGGDLDFVLTKAQLNQRIGKEKNVLLPFYVRDQLEMNAEIELELVYRAPQARVRKIKIHVTAQARHTGGINLNDRDRTYFNLLQQLGKNFDAEVTKQLGNLGVLTIVK